MILPILFIAETSRKGRGVFTHEAIDADTIIEQSPVIVMNSLERRLIDQTLLHDYIFEWENDDCCMALGYIPLYNHRAPSNCEYFQDYEQQLIYVKTVRAIEAGEELTINYNGDWDDTREVWFNTSD